jgi:hypothetical protein
LTGDRLASQNPDNPAHRATASPPHCGARIGLKRRGGRSGNQNAFRRVSGCSAPCASPSSCPPL